MMSILVGVGYILSGLSTTARASGPFVQRLDDQLLIDGRPFRFVSFNIPTLHYIEDNMAFTVAHPWRLPDTYEISDALASIEQMGGQVVRLYALSVRKDSEDPNLPRHVLGPGLFDERAFRALDEVLYLAERYRIKLIIPFVDNWSWWGGVAEYAAFRNKQLETFWHDEQIKADFRETIRYVLNRRNTYNGRLYKDDPTVLAWETGNELHSPEVWTREMAAYVKALNGNHLLIDGYHTSELEPNQVLAQPHIDMVTTHHYQRNPRRILQMIRRNLQLIDGRKAYFIGEVGFLTNSGFSDLLDLVVEEPVAGLLVWGLRPHNRDGGFYWHSEPGTHDLFKAYHWPGFASGSVYRESDFLNLIREKAFAIRNLKPPPLPVPGPPELLPIEDIGSISWRGSAGAAGYHVERSVLERGPWEVVGRNVSNAVAPYRPLFHDETACIGSAYFYRIRAVNRAGISLPSNIVGPVRVEHQVLVDEMIGSEKLYAFSGLMRFETLQARRFKEDMHRLYGEKGGCVVYRVPQTIRHGRIYAFYTSDPPERLQLYVSQDGVDYTVALNEELDCTGDENLYGYHPAFLYRFRTDNAEVRYLKIHLNGPTQLSRVEIYHGP